MVAYYIRVEHIGVHSGFAVVAAAAGDIAVAPGDREDVGN